MDFVSNMHFEKVLGMDNSEQAIFKRRNSSMGMSIQSARSIMKEESEIGENNNDSP